MADLSILDLKPEIYRDIAAGVIPPAEVFVQHGLTVEDYMKAATYPHFHKEVARQQAELEADGWTPKARMNRLAEMLLVNAAAAALKSDSVQNKLDVGKYLAKISGLEPQPGNVLAGGGGFSVVFNFSGQKPITIEATPDSAPTLIDSDMWPTEPPAHVQELSSDNTDLSEGIDDSRQLHTSPEC